MEIGLCKKNNNNNSVCNSYDSVFPSFQSGSSPLLVASYKGNVEVVRTLLNYHARVDVFDEVLTVTKKDRQKSINQSIDFVFFRRSIEAVLTLSHLLFYVTSRAVLLYTFALNEAILKWRRNCSSIKPM